VCFILKICNRKLNLISILQIDRHCKHASFLFSGSDYHPLLDMHGNDDIVPECDQAFTQVGIETKKQCSMKQHSHTYFM